MKIINLKKTALACILICAVITGFSVPASAEDTLKNVNVSSDGIITWDSYPGADDYHFEILHEAIVTSYMLGNVASADLEALFDQANTDYSGILVSGMYQYKIIAYKAGNPVASTTQSYAYHYTPPAPLEASVSSDGILTWKAYPGAASYDYGAGDQMVVHEGSTLQADLKDFIDLMISLGKLNNTGSHSVLLIARDSLGTELARWEGSCSYKASHSIADAVVETIMDSYEYTGKAIIPKPVVTYQKNQLTAGTDYTVSYKNNKKIGTAALTVTGKGAYTGSKTVPFQILPKGTVLKKLTAGETQITVTWKKQKKQITGYRIQYSLKKNFKNAKTVTVKKAAAGKKKLKNLKSGKRYYVRICTCKKVGKKTYCSAWSKVLKIKTKKAGE